MGTRPEPEATTSRATGSLSLSGIGVNCDGVELIKDLDLSVEPGELVAIMGPSGCGKTTLLRVVAGLLEPSAGRITLGGRSPEKVGWTTYRRRVTYVSQRPTLLDETVAMNLEHPFSYGSWTHPYSVERAADLLDRLQIGADRMNQPARSLSVGQQQRVCCVRAVLAGPSFLLLDEPISALDEEAAIAVQELISELAEEQDLGALIVSHDRDRAKGWCHRHLDLGLNGLATPQES